jgi:hypothetical protein
MKDLHNNIKVTTVLAPVTIDSDTTTAGEVIDTQGFDSLEFVLQAGALTDGVFTAALAESDTVDESGDLTSEGVVAASDLIGSLPSVENDASDESGLSKKVGYRGRKRYVRLDVVSTGTDDGGVVGAIAIQEGARNNPVS